MPDQPLRASDYALDSSGDAVRVIKAPQASTDGLYIVRYLDGRMPVKGQRYADQGLFAVADLRPNPTCGHGVPIYGVDCDECDEGNAIADNFR